MKLENSHIHRHMSTQTAVTVGFI